MAPALPSETRIDALDGLRGIAAIMVIAWHLTGSMMSREGWTEAVYAATIFGRTGVDLFFVLSGFLIIGILVDRRDSPNLFRVFYLRRACRIVPPYATLIVLFWLCYLLLGESAAFNAYGFPGTLVAQLAFAWNLWMSWLDEPIARGFSITWSVDIEEHFYLVFPLLIWLCPRSRIAWLLSITGLLSWIGRAGFHLGFPDWINPPYMFSPFRLDGLCAGGLLALAYRSEAAMALLRRFRTELYAASILGLATVPFVIASIRNELFFHMYLWGHAYLNVVYVLLLASIIVNSGRMNLLRSSFLRKAGRYSYSLYLFHPLFLSLFFVVAGRREAILAPVDLALTAGSLLVTIVFCVILYERVERRFQARGQSSAYDKHQPERAYAPEESATWSNAIPGGKA